MNKLNNKVLELKKISKLFPGVVALDSIDFDLKEGEVHALIGENGAGKSTLVNILAGVYPQNEGKIFLHGKEIIFFDEMDSINKGISIVFQERSLVPQMSVADNIFAARQPANRLGFISNKRLLDQSKEILEKLNLDIKPNSIVKELSASKQQEIEIAKALSLNAKILILDEVTATITVSETKVLFNLIEDLKKKGITIIYISHRLEEIFKIADRVTVLKDGKLVCTKSVKETNIDELIQLITGRELKFDISQKSHENLNKNQVIFEVSDFNRGNDFQNISFKLYKGEILGIGGLVGAGKTEVAKSLFGIDRIDKGEVFISGEKVKIGAPVDSIKLEIGFIPEDRRDEGLFTNMNIEENVVSTNLKEFSNFGFLNPRKILNFTKKAIKKFRIVTPSSKQKVANLSGGNQQKVVLSKWFDLKNKILIVDEPTRGIDVGAKSEIYEFLYNIVELGTSIIIISSEFKELINFCDRIIVFYEGKIAGELFPEKTTEEEILRLASGLKK